MLRKPGKATHTNGGPQNWLHHTDGSVWGFEGPIPSGFISKANERNLVLRPTTGGSFYLVRHSLQKLAEMAAETDRWTKRVAFQAMCLTRTGAWPLSQKL